MSHPDNYPALFTQTYNRMDKPGWQFLLCLTLLALLGPASVVHAGQFYKWTDDQGLTHYSEAPPPSGKSNRLDIEVPPAGSLGSAMSPLQKPVVIYTAEWCGVCRTAKKYFAENNIIYSEYDVEKSAKGRSDYYRLQGRGVPIVLVGEERMDGFSAQRFEKMRSSSK